MNSIFDEVKLLTFDEETASRAIVRLRECGCCTRCILRFLCVKEASPYRMVDSRTTIEQLMGLQDLVEISNEQPKESTDGAWVDEVRVGLDKNTESGLCIACLGVLQEQYCKQIFLEEIREVVSKQDFEYRTFFCSLSLPVCLLLREHSLWVVLNELQPSIFDEDFRNKIIPVKDVWKWVNGAQLANILGVPFDQKSTFAISLTFVHPSTEHECSFLYNLCPNVFQKRKHNRHGWEVFNRANVLKAIQNTTVQKFKNVYHCPPRKLSSPCDCDPIKCLREAVYVAGRYNKFSRQLSQTPWFVDGVKRFETSVEELICKPILDLFKASEYKFSASGREDVDVRMLGNGRPFVIELINPRRVIFTPEQLLALQLDVNSSTTAVKVHDVQIVAKEETSILKEGEEEKIKRYRALCWIKDMLSDEHLNKVSNLGNIVVHQKTPIRVLHRRTLAVRDRAVHSMSASKVDDHHFHLYLSTQAGTYIKEFVHGDFGRTVPNLAIILGTECDIVELDVEAVELDWPKSLGIDYKD